MSSFESLVSRYWWTLLLRGMVAILFGVLTFVWPHVTLAVLILLFGAYALVDGIAAIIMGISQHGERERWWATLIGGVISVGAGVITFFRPGITAVALLAIIAFWAIARGIFEIVAAIRLRHAIEGEWLMVLEGAVSIAFGVLLVAFPGAGALAVIWWIGAFALVMGVVLVMLSFRLRGVGNVVHARA